ncbi:hypothetical protein [uncultured Tateyamaria sp.]|nr:hypothetical protein [uncultured Tateyamaria sp.]
MHITLSTAKTITLAFAIVVGCVASGEALPFVPLESIFEAALAH